MKNIAKLFAVFALAFLNPFQSFSQDQQDSTLYSIETTDGNEFIGRIIYRDEDNITLLTDKLGEIKLFTKYIKSIKEVSPANFKNGDFWFDNPQSARYFWAPNGYGLKKGEAYYQNVWIFFNQVSVGLTDNFSLGAGIVPLFIFAGTATPVWVAPKFSIPVVKDKFNVGVGALAGIVIGESGASFGIVFGSTTFGSKDKNLTLGLGYGFADGEWATTPALNVSGMLRTGPRGYLLTENYYLGFDGDGLGLISFGGRRIVKKISLDFGGFIPIAGDTPFIIIPWLGIAVPIGKKQPVEAN